MSHLLLLLLWASICCWRQVSPAPYSGGAPLKSIKDSNEELIATSSISVAVEQDYLNDNKLTVTTTRVQDLLADSEDSIAQTATIFKHVFDLGMSSNYLSKSGIPLRLYPSKISRLSAFAFVISSSSDKSEWASLSQFKHSKNKMLSSYRKDYEGTTLWTGKAAEDYGSVELILEIEKESRARKIRVQPSINGIQLEELFLSLPAFRSDDPSMLLLSQVPTASSDADVVSRVVSQDRIGSNGIEDQEQTSAPFTVASSDYLAEASILDTSDDNGSPEIYLHYYRGIQAGSYSQIRCFKDQVEAVLIGFVFPFLFLGVAFAAIAFFVYVVLRRDQMTGDDETANGKETHIDNDDTASQSEKQGIYLV